MEFANWDALASSLQQWSTNPEVAITQVRPLAEAGDLGAITLLAWFLGPQTGRYTEGVGYARTAIEAGNTYLAFQYGQALSQQGDPATKAQALDWLRVALDDGWPVDTMGPALQAAQQGDTAAAQQLFEMASEARPAGARRRWDALLAETAEDRQRVNEAATTVNAEQERAFGEIRQALDVVEDRRRSVEQLAEQVGVLANKTAGGAIAEDYARRAEVVEETARRYTYASIVLAILIAAGAVVATFMVKGGGLVDDAASKAAVAVPLVALNLYLGRLAAQYRQEAVALRHIELQFNTANPFLGALDDERRRAVLAQLALKFFPGQALPGGAPVSGDGPNVDSVFEQVLARAGIGSGAPDSGAGRNSAS